MQSLRHAARALARTPVFTTTAALTLVIGIAAVVAIFSVVDGVLLKPLPYGQADRLVGAWHDLPPLNLKKANQTSATYFAYARYARSIEGIGVYNDGSVNVADPRSNSEPQRVPAGFISASIVPVLQLRPLLGRNFSADEDRPNGAKVVLISEEMWRTRFSADRGVIGRRFDVNGESREIVGVMPDNFRFPRSNTQVWVPMALDPDAQFPGGFNYNAIARLKPGVTLEAARRDFEATLPRTTEVAPMLAPGVTWEMVVKQADPKPVITALSEDIVGDISRTLWMVAAAAGLVLLVACFNVANLILVRADGRQRELAVREALGAGRARVLGHFLAESAILAGVAAVLGLALASASVRALVAAGPTNIPRLSEIGIDARTVAFTIAIAALVAVVCSVIPALRIGRVVLARALREGGRSGTAGKAQQRVRGALVAAQIALALVVLAVSGLLLRSYQRLVAVQPGFQPANVATLWLSPRGTKYQGGGGAPITRFYAQLTERIAQLPGVQAVGITSRLPLMAAGMNQNPFFPEGDPRWEQKIPPLQLFATTDGGYFKAVGATLIAGRVFDRLETQSAMDAVISEQTAKTFFDTPANAIGKRFRPLPSGPFYTVIGVVGSMRDTALAGALTASVYFPQVVGQDTVNNQVTSTMAVVVRTSGDAASIIPAVQRAVRDLDPALPTFEARTMQSVVDRSMARLSFVMVILGAAAVVTLLLGAIGLYGVMAYLVTLRTRELGVRIALGAAPASVTGMMTRQGVVLTALGIVGGLAVFLGIARFLRSFLYDIAPTDPTTLVGASVLLAVIATLASWIPARRSARVDPAISLRAE